jgi:hypothetical protein
MESKAQVTRYLVMSLECRMRWFMAFQKHPLTVRIQFTCNVGFGVGGNDDYDVYFGVPRLDKK